MADEDQMLNARVPGCAGKIARTFNVGGEQVSASSLGAGSGEMIDLVHTAQRCPDAALVVQADDCYFNRHTFRNARRLRRRAKEYANLLSSLGEMTNKGAPDESRCACD